MIAENFPNLQRELPRCRKLTEHQTVHQYLKRNTARHIIIKAFSTQNKERILKTSKEKR
jgi:hypothetical protein